MENSPPAFAVVAEAHADARMACDLADRVFVEDEASLWLGRDLLDYVRTWSGLDEHTPFTRWTRIKHLARQHGIHFVRHTRRGKAGSIDYAQARKAIILAEWLAPDRPLRALLLIRDLDTQVERRTGMEEARAEFSETVLQVIIGAANPKREAWVLNGFEPESPEDEETLVELRQELGFHACEHPERLTAKSDQAKRSAKRVLSVLTGGSPEREARCWTETPLDVLKERGAATGLRAYLEEIEDRLVPLLTGQRQ